MKKKQTKKSNKKFDIVIGGRGIGKKDAMIKWAEEHPETRVINAMDDIVDRELTRLATRGPAPKYTPYTLLLKFKEYCDWVRNNPLYAAKLDKGKLLAEPRMRAMSKSAFQIYASISTRTYLQMETGKGNVEAGQREDHYKDYVGVVDVINKAIYNQKFEGAAADMLNSNLISRDLGLTDKKEIKGFIITGDEPIEFE